MHKFTIPVKFFRDEQRNGHLEIKQFSKNTADNFLLLYFQCTGQRGEANRFLRAVFAPYTALQCRFLLCRVRCRLRLALLGLCVVWRTVGRASRSHSSVELLGRPRTPRDMHPTPCRPEAWPTESGKAPARSPPFPGQKVLMWDVA